MEDLTEGARASCRNCGEGIIVREVRTGKMFAPPFWEFAWVHENPQMGTNGRRCYVPMAAPLEGTIILASAPLEVSGFGGMI